MSFAITRIHRYPKNFHFTTSTGKEFTLADFKGKWLYLMFHRHLL
ncbi:MAG: hypothetical protein V2I36_16625 [Desulfopila sp.]|jgi:cytochrome oxidase Cu insertion factor (SCO1/SenC/PrrC family)|nr:hypothetical protein [Desulfopila sp.]